MTTIDQLLSKHSDNYRFHGAGDFLSDLIAQAEDGAIRLWGRDHDDAVDGEAECEWVQGEGFLYCTDIRGVEVIYNNFSGNEGLVLILEKQVENPQEWSPRTGDRRESLIRAEEWRVIGAIRPIFDEDGEEVDQEAFSLEEILNEEF
jgi:hypothetical protein